jgi:hypothetical protein
MDIRYHTTVAPPFTTNQPGDTAAGLTFGTQQVPLAATAMRDIRCPLGNLDTDTGTDIAEVGSRMQFHGSAVRHAAGHA